MKYPSADKLAIWCHQTVLVTNNLDLCDPKNSKKTMYTTPFFIHNLTQDNAEFWNSKKTVRGKDWCLESFCAYKLKHLEVSNVATKMFRFLGNCCLKTCGCVKMSCVKKKYSEKKLVAKEFPRTCVPEKMQQTPEDI